MFQAVACDPGTAELLEIDTASPILLYESIARDDTGRPHEVAYHHFRGDAVAASINRGDHLTSIAKAASFGPRTPAEFFPEIGRVVQLVTGGGGSHARGAKAKR
jgi:hypothetical protein